MNIKKIILKIAFNFIFNYIDKNKDGKLEQDEIRDLLSQIKHLNDKIILEVKTSKNGKDKSN